MPYYYVNRNAQANGDHEVHESACAHGAAYVNRITLGYHTTCHGAVAEAKRTHPTANGCFFCCPDCNRG